MNYASILSLVQRLLQANGKSISLTKYASASTRVGSLTTPTTITVYAVEVPPSSLTNLGMSIQQVDFTKSFERTFIATPHASEDLETFNVFTEGGVVYKLKTIDRLRPADTTLLYYLGAMR